MHAIELYFKKTFDIFFFAGMFFSSKGSRAKSLNLI